MLQRTQLHTVTRGRLRFSFRCEFSRVLVGAALELRPISRVAGSGQSRTCKMCASPKSVSRALNPRASVAADLSSTLSLFTSQCTSPRSCTYASAIAICAREMTSSRAVDSALERTVAVVLGGTLSLFASLHQPALMDVRQRQRDLCMEDCVILRHRCTSFTAFYGIDEGIDAGGFAR